MPCSVPSREGAGEAIFDGREEPCVSVASAAPGLDLELRAEHSKHGRRTSAGLDPCVYPWQALVAAAPATVAAAHATGAAAPATVAAAPATPRLQVPHRKTTRPKFAATHYYTQLLPTPPPHSTATAGLRSIAPPSRCPPPPPATFARAPRLHGCARTSYGIIPIIAPATAATPPSLELLLAACLILRHRHREMRARETRRREIREHRRRHRQVDCER